MNIPEGLPLPDFHKGAVDSDSAHPGIDVASALKLGQCHVGFIKRVLQGVLCVFVMPCNRDDLLE